MARSTKTVKKTTRKVARSARSGEFVSRKKAKANPDTTVVETVKVTKKAKAPPAVKEKPLPAGVLTLVEELAKANAKTRKASAVFTEAKEKEDAIRSDLLALFGKKKIDGMKHRLGTVTLVRTEYAEVQDMEAALKYAKLKGNSDILTVGISTKAVRARWEDGKEVPGVVKGKREDLRFTPAKK